MTAGSRDASSVVALAGGVGGARLVDGLSRALPPGALTVVVNTGDDFRHWGLHISPDLDTIMYTLAGLSAKERGWGIQGDTFNALAEAERRGDESWFRLGDRDLVTHLFRTRALQRGDSLTDATASLCASLGVRRMILPMADAPRPTVIVTRAGEEMAFQEWLVKARAVPEVARVVCRGATKPTAAVLDALQRADLVIICPSNPYVSIDPILTLDGVRETLLGSVTIGVSPIIGGQAVKGPLAGMISQLEGRPASAEEVARHYEDLLNGFAVHLGDGFTAPFPVLETNILIQAKEDRVLFARELLEFARGLP